MFGSKKPKSSKEVHSSSKGPVTKDVPILFAIIFLLSIAELGFTVYAFQLMQRKHDWSSSTERARLAFLIFSSLRTILLSAVYVGFHFAQKWFKSMAHTIFLVISTILWVISGVLIHGMWGVLMCGGVGDLQGGLNECHTLKIVEILAWVLAGVSVLATIPVVWNWMKVRKREHSRKTARSG